MAQFNLEELKIKWKEEREQKTNGKTIDEIAEMDIIEEVEYLNNEIGNLVGYECRICKNKGVTYHRHMDEENKYNHYVRDCECLKIRTALKRISESGLTEVIEQKTFDTYIATEEWQKQLRSFAEEYERNFNNSNKWLIFCGAVGIGKSHLCTAIVGKWLKYGIQVIYMPYRDDIPKIKRAMTDDIKYAKMMDLWQTCTVLYVDDLYKGRLTESDPAIMFEIIDYRYRNNKRTIISTEKSYDELISIDEAVASRIFEKCGDNKIEIKKDISKNYRIKDIL